jgi:hypothetical protein
MNPAAISSIPGATQSAAGMMERAGNALAKNAAVVAGSPDVISRETVQALLDSRQQVLYTSAGAKLIEASEQMTRRLVDMMA